MPIIMFGTYYLVLIFPPIDSSISLNPREYQDDKKEKGYERCMLRSPTVVFPHTQDMLHFSKNGHNVSDSLFNFHGNEDMKLFRYRGLA